MEYVRAFITGGVICMLAQILMDKTKLLPGRIMVIIVCLGAVLGAVGIYGYVENWGGTGATVPLLGFGANLFKGMKDSVDESGFIGLFKGGFTACSVGVSAAIIFGYIVSFFFNPKPKD